MTDNKKIEIALSKSKLTKLLIVSILFLCGGLWILIADPQTDNALFNHSFIKALGSYGGIAMGLFGIYFFIRKLGDKKPGLVIDETGIFENASAFHFGFIPWSDISDIYERSVQVSFASRQHFITIHLCDPKKYIDREKSALKRQLMRANANSYGSPVHISTNGLNINHKELLQMITAEFARYKSSQER